MYVDEEAQENLLDAMEEIDGDGDGDSEGYIGDSDSSSGDDFDTSSRSSDGFQSYRVADGTGIDTGEDNMVEFEWERAAGDEVEVPVWVEELAETQWRPTGEARR